MSETRESMAQRRAQLAATIARQRGELSDAYRNLAKPLFYADYGIKGFGFLRSNPWILSVVPAATSIIGTLIGIYRNKPAKGVAAARSARRSVEREVERDAKKVEKDWKKIAATWGMRGWKLFGLYRRFRKYLPR